MATATPLLPPRGLVRPAAAPLVRLNLALLALLAAGLTGLLWPQWLHNPDLSHGLFMPLVFALLVHEARTAGPRRFLRPTPARRAAFALVLSAGLLALAAGGLYAAALEWSHALVGFTLAGALSLLLLAALLAFAGEDCRLVPFNWSALLAAGLWVGSAPIPPGSYSRLTLGLQLWVSEDVLRALHALGIAAHRDGNIIELARTSVGIEEACSGVRSLLSCLFAGFFFSGCLVRRPWARACIIALAAPLALLMNFIRSLVLTLLANAGVSIGGLWHDLTGYAVLGITAALLGGAALALARGDGRAAARSRAAGRTAGSAPPGGLQLRLAAGLTLAVALAGFFALHGTVVPPAAGKPPELAAVLPAAPPGWRVVTASELNRFSGALQTDDFLQRTYLKDTPAGLLQVTVYVAYWAPGQASVSLVATHTPDACWPGAGWEPVPVLPARETLQVAGRDLPPAEHRLFQSDGFPQQVWFWHLYGGAPVRYINPLSPRNLLEIAARYGFRHAGDQLFVRVSSNRPWADFSADPLTHEIFTRLQPFGL